MSALDQKQTFAAQKGVSALPPKADIRRCDWNVLPEPAHKRLIIPGAAAMPGLVGSLVSVPCALPRGRGRDSPYAHAKLLR